MEYTAEQAIKDALTELVNLSEKEGDSEELREARGHLEQAVQLLHDRDRRIKEQQARDELAQSEAARREASVLRESERLEEEHAALLAAQADSESEGINES